MDKLTEHRALHICRNPYGWSGGEIRAARHFICDRLESYKNAYENMRQFAIDNGLDVTTYHGPLQEQDDVGQATEK